MKKYFSSPFRYFNLFYFFNEIGLLLKKWKGGLKVKLHFLDPVENYEKIKKRMIVHPLRRRVESFEKKAVKLGLVPEELFFDVLEDHRIELGCEKITPSFV